mgnify:CR=1 FL=1
MWQSWPSPLARGVDAARCCASAMPLVSVIIPTHNRRDLVCEAVASVLAQRDAGVEVIVVDDGSTDDTRGALRCTSATAIRYVRQPTRGVSAARNHGARLAGRTWLAFLDSDDLWQPDKLARQLAYHARTPDAARQPDRRDLDPQRRARQPVPPSPASRTATSSRPAWRAAWSARRR